jgi:hypothetical protein
MYSTEAPQIIEHLNQSLTFTPTDVRWVPSSARFVLMGEKPKGTAALQVYELGVGKATLIHEVSVSGVFNLLPGIFARLVELKAGVDCSCCASLRLTV